jgi:hypothetical protein
MVATADAHARYVPPGYVLYPTGGALVAQRFDTSGARLIGEPIRLSNVAANWPHG